MDTSGMFCDNSQSWWAFSCIGGAGVLKVVLAAPVCQNCGMPKYTVVIMGTLEHKHSSRFVKGQDVLICGSSSAVTVVGCLVKLAKVKVSNLALSFVPCCLCKVASIQPNICVSDDTQDDFVEPLSAGFGRKDVVEFLLANGAKPDAQDDGGLIPLHNACSFGHSEVVSVLLQHGADPNTRDNWNYTPLHESAHKGKVAVCICK